MPLHALTMHGPHPSLCADSANALQSLGRGINILTVDPSLYSTMITSGAPFLFSDPTLANCVSGQNAIDAQNVYELYTSSSATENAITDDFSLDASLWGQAISLSTSYTDITKTSEEVMTMKSDIWQVDHSYNINDSCVRCSPLHPDLVSDWAALRNNYDTTDPFTVQQGYPLWSVSRSNCLQQLGPWSAYYNVECKLVYDFVQRWGTHMVTGVKTGSRASYWASSLTTKSYNEEDFKAKICASVNGLDASVNACAGVSTQAIQQSSSYDIRITKHILGGVEHGAGAQLAASNSASDSIDIMAQFMNEAANSTSPIFYSLKPIWEVLGMRRDATPVDQALMVLFNRIAGMDGWLFFPATVSK